MSWLRHLRPRSLRAVVAILGGVLLGGALLGVWLAREPRYGGKTLREWEVLLNSPRPEERAAAVEGLRREGEAAGLDLAQEVAAADSLGRRAYRRLRPLVPDAVHNRLRWMIKEEERIRRQATAVRALGSLGGKPTPEALDAVRIALQHEHVLLNLAAMDALRRFGVDGLPVLVGALEAGSAQMRQFACVALAELGTNAAVAAPLLAGLLETGGPDLQAKAATTLAFAGPGGIAWLTQTLSSTNQHTRQWAAYGLGLSGPAGVSAVPALIPLALGDPRPATREAALRALVKVDWSSPEVVRLLLDAAESREESLALPALEGIANRPRAIRENLGRLEALLEHPSPLRRAAAARAIGQGGRHAAAAIPRLRSMASGTNALATQAALGALRLIEPPPTSNAH